MSTAFLGAAIFFCVWAILPEPERLRWFRCSLGLVCLIAGLGLRLSGDQPCHWCMDIPLYGMVFMLRIVTALTIVAALIDPKLWVVAAACGMCALAARIMRGKPMAA